MVQTVMPFYIEGKDMVASGLRHTCKLFYSDKRKQKDSAFGVARLISHPLFSSSTLEDLPLWWN